MIIVSEQEFYCPKGQLADFAYGQAVLKIFESMDAFKESLDDEAPKEWGDKEVFVSVWNDLTETWGDTDVEGTLYTWIEV
jgi:hypothetical protein